MAAARRPRNAVSRGHRGGTARLLELANCSTCTEAPMAPPAQQPDRNRPNQHNSHASMVVPMGRPAPRPVSACSYVPSAHLLHHLLPSLRLGGPIRRVPTEHIPCPVAPAMACTCPGPRRKSFNTSRRLLTTPFLFYRVCKFISLTLFSCSPLAITVGSRRRPYVTFFLSSFVGKA